MANEFVQRQLTGFMGPGADLLPSQYAPSDYRWQIQDVYPSKIMKLDPGKYTAGTLTLAATSGSDTLPLPGNYDSANRLAVFISSDQTIKAVTVSPAHATSTVMITAGAAQSGLLFYVERVTSITLSNAGATAAVVSYSTWEYPADITVASAWQGGFETTGVASE